MEQTTFPLDIVKHIFDLPVNVESELIAGKLFFNVV